MWKFILRDLAGTALGELWNATDRELAIPLNGLPTAAFTIRNDSPFADVVLDGDCLLSIYEDATLRFHGELTSAEEAVAENTQSIKCTSAGLLWRLLHRLAGKSAAGVTYGDPSSQLDRGVIAGHLLDTANSEGNTGIRPGSITDSSLTYIYDPPWRFKPIAEAISELSAVMDGFDFEVAPVEPTSDSLGLKLGELNIAAAFGQDRPDVAFEYGDGKHNITSWKRTVDRTTLLNLGWHLPPTFPDTTQAIVNAYDEASLLTRGRHEGVVDGPVTALPLRQRLVDEHVRVRRFPKQTVTFEPKLAAFEYGTDFEVGDTVRARAKVPNANDELEERLNVAVRVYGVTFADTAKGDMALTAIETMNEALFS